MRTSLQKWLVYYFYVDMPEINLRITGALKYHSAAHHLHSTPAVGKLNFVVYLYALCAWRNQNTDYFRFRFFLSCSSAVYYSMSVWCLLFPTEKETCQRKSYFSYTECDRSRIEKSAYVITLTAEFGWDFEMYFLRSVPKPTGEKPGRHCHNTTKEEYH